MSLLVLDRVEKRYRAGLRDAVVLRDACLEIECGETVGVWGGRHAGKSTLLRIMAGAVKPDAGRVIFEGRDLAGLRAGERARLLRHGGIALVSEPRQHRNSVAVDYVAVALLACGMSLRAARRVARTALESAGVARCADLWLDRLSPGELLRVEVARALARGPRVLLIDEPSLRSPSEAAEIFELLHELGRDRGRALVIASEDITPLRGASRIATVGSGGLRVEPGRGEDDPGVVLPLRSRRAS